MDIPQAEVTKRAKTEGKYIESEKDTLEVVL